MIDTKTIDAAYDGVKHWTGQLAITTGREYDLQAQIDRKRADLIASGEIDGKNADTREGQIKARLASEYTQLRDLHTERDRQRTSLDLARLEVDRCKTLLKLLEVSRP